MTELEASERERIALRDAVERCYRHFLTVEVVVHSPAAWGVVELNQGGELVLGDVRACVGELSPRWEGPAGTHPMLTILERARGKA